MKLKPILELHKIAARLWQQNVFAAEDHMSLPIPVYRISGLTLAFLYCIREHDDEHMFRLSAPTYVAYLSALPKYDIIEEIVGYSSSETKAFAECLLDSRELRSQSYADESKALLREYDEVLPLYAAKSADTLSSQEKELVVTFRDRFSRLREQPLVADYKRLGGPFFLWLSQADPQERSSSKS